MVLCVVWVQSSILMAHLVVNCERVIGPARAGLEGPWNGEVPAVGLEVEGREPGDGGDQVGGRGS